MKISTEPSSDKNVNEMFRDIRSGYRISQEIIASRLGISQNMVHYKETGRNNITAKDVSALEECIREQNKGVLPDDIFESFVEMYYLTGEIPHYAEPDPEQYRDFIRLCMEKGKAVFGFITESDNYISVNEAAEILDMSRQRVNVLAKSGRLNSIIINNTRRISRKSILAYKSSPKSPGRPTKEK